MPIVTVVNTPAKDSTPLTVLDGGYLKQMSFNPFDGGTFESVGKSHGRGGMPVDSTGNGQPNAEIEGGETAHTSPFTGDKYIGGNLTIPGTKKKFKKAFKEIGKQEDKASRIMGKANKLIEQSNPENKYGVLKHNSGNIMNWSAMRQQATLAATKEELSQTQQAIHTLADAHGMEPEKVLDTMENGGKLGAKKVTVVGVPEMRSGGELPIARDGFKTQNEDIFKAIEKHPERFKYVDWAKEAAEAAGIDVGLFQRLLFRESAGFNPRATSYVGAKGIAQFMPKTYQGLGGDPADLGSTAEPAIRRQLALAAKHFKNLEQQNGGQPFLAAIAYNGGQGAVDYVKKETRNKNLSANDWISFMEERREKAPTNKRSAWQNQTYDYVRALSPEFVSNADFYAGKAPKGIKGNPDFHKEYYAEPPKPTDMPALPLAGNLNGRMPQLVQPEVREFTPGQQADYSALTSQEYNKPGRTPSLADSNKLGIGQLLPEIMALGDQPGFVPRQQLNPTLYQDYRVSFQDRLNANTSSFNSVAKQMQNNPEALATLAAQKYNADNGVQAEEFRTNQAIENDITNKNIAIINQTREKNLALNDQQFIRQEQGRVNTRQNKQAAINSISSKIGQNRLENNNIRMQENLFNYRYNPVTGKMEYVGPPADLTASIPGTAYNPYAETVNKKTTNADGETTTSTTTRTKPSANRRYWGGGKMEKKWKF